MIEDFYIPPVTTAPPVEEMTAEEKANRRNKVLMVFGVLSIIAFFLSWNGDARSSGEVFGRYLGIAIILCLGYYAAWKPKRKADAV